MYRKLLKLDLAKYVLSETFIQIKPLKIELVLLPAILSNDLQLPTELFQLHILVQIFKIILIKFCTKLKL